MNIKSLLCFVCAISLCGAAATQAQSLPELARAEKARRAKMRAASGPAKLYTENNRSGDSAATASTEAATDATPAAAAPAAPGAAQEKTPAELAAEAQKAWMDKVTAAQTEITELEGIIQTNERNLASLINITPARVDLANRIEADKQKLAALRQTLVDLEDERRRAGLPRIR